MKRIIFGMFMLAASSTVLAAQLYRWVDDKGNVEYRDTPPPSTAKKVEQRSTGSGEITTQGRAQQAARTYPVTLWNAACGAPCEEARAHLERRGVPYTEKGPQPDAESFRRATSGLDLPVLYVGSTRLSGYRAGEWDGALDIAGYPRAPGVRPAADRAPVKLYTHPECGPPCVEAKNLLTGRKIPFQEISVGEQAELDQLQEVSGESRVPLLLVGSTITRGFSASEYNLALDAGGFPRAGGRP